MPGHAATLDFLWDPKGGVQHPPSFKIDNAQVVMIAALAGGNRLALCSSLCSTALVSRETATWQLCHCDSTVAGDLGSLHHLCGRFEAAAPCRSERQPRLSAIRALSPCCP